MPNVNNASADKAQPEEPQGPSLVETLTAYAAKNPQMVKMVATGVATAAAGVASAFWTYYTTPSSNLNENNQEQSANSSNNESRVVSTATHQNNNRGIEQSRMHPQLHSMFGAFPDADIDYCDESHTMVKGNASKGNYECVQKRYKKVNVTKRGGQSMYDEEGNDEDCKDVNFDIKKRLKIF